MLKADGVVEYVDAEENQVTL
ncbi:MAG: hypothetical protein U5N85_16475 [Arcicella sp.]|nr:hypothetical protein [Arcicella sp.]